MKSGFLYQQKIIFLFQTNRQRREFFTELA